ncbi:MAG: hypothetical protein H7A53_06800 [Akkermansiaceae bacterium]|nr:hypothetical protein [Akkermansiaceae bacterium]MCP5550581.1 hypothetical protein [Akkermansiaceae bacterium]
MDDDEASGGRIRWWLWPNVLGLDAPVVAVVWLWAFARSGGAEWPGGAVFAALFGAVWCIYLADRLADARRAGPVQAPRHLAARRHGNFFAVLLAGVAAATATVTLRHLPASLLGPGAVLAGVAGLYFWVFVRSAGKSSRPGKEIAAGAIFAAGVTLPVWARTGIPGPPLAVAIGVFAGICALNCLAIEERETTRRPGRLRLLAWLCLACGGLPWIPPDGGAGSRELGLCLTAAAAAEAAAFFSANRMTPDRFRVLADAALLAPLWILPCG